MFDWPKKARGMQVVCFVASLFGVASTRCEWWREWGNGQDVGEQVSSDVSLNPEF